MDGQAAPRSVHVVASLDPAFGGPSYSVPRLCQALSRAGSGATLLSVADENIAETDTVDAGFRDRRFPQSYAKVPLLGSLRISAGLSRALRSDAAEADIVHDHGLWLMPNLEAGWAAGAAGKALIVAPRGMLSPAALSFSALKKRWFWRLFQGPALRQTRCFHATSRAEAEDIWAFGLKAPVAILPNGIDLPDLGPVDFDSRRTRTVLALGRIHPKKALDQLVVAWAKVAKERSDWRMRIVGPDERGYAHDLALLAGKVGASGVSIEGPAYGEEKWQAYRDADLFVLPTLNENFGMVVAEALAAGIPVISTKGAPWERLHSERCGWWIDHGVDPLTSALLQATALPPTERAEMGRRGRSWMAREFGWDAIAQSMRAVYSWAAGGGDPPPCIATQ